jgi:hypothetical protein
MIRFLLALGDRREMIELFPEWKMPSVKLCNRILKTSSRSRYSPLVEEVSYLTRLDSLKILHPPVPQLRALLPRISII